jgi:hypothetical protein
MPNASHSQQKVVTLDQEVNGFFHLLLSASKLNEGLQLWSLLHELGHRPVHTSGEQQYAVNGLVLQASASVQDMGQHQACSAYMCVSTMLTHLWWFGTWCTNTRDHPPVKGAQGWLQVMQAK